MANNNKHTFKHLINEKKTAAKEPAKIPTYPQILRKPLRYLYIYFIREFSGGKLRFIQKISVITLFIVLPWNLGKHVINDQSYVEQVSIPYLIPTMYVQDLLILASIFTGILLGFRSVRPFLNKEPMRLFLLFLVASFLSIFFSSRTLPSVYFFIRVSLYFLFILFTAPVFYDRKVRRAFFISLLFNLMLLSLLGIVQFYKQSSVFDNYLIMGEQPYNIYTPAIAREVYRGLTRIPPYGTFMHPNIFSGFLVISLTYVWLYGRKEPRYRKYLTPFLFAGLYVLYLTRSYVSWAALLGGFFLIRQKGRLPVMTLGALVLLLGLALPVYKEPLRQLLPESSSLSFLSVERRAELLISSYKMFREKPLFGWGLNSFTYSAGNFYSDPANIRFTQPVHNVYALITVESGMFGLLFFISVTFYVLRLLIAKGDVVYTAVIMEFMVLSSFDHYPVTIHQTYLLYMLTLIMALTYTKEADCL